MSNKLKTAVAGLALIGAFVAIIAITYGVLPAVAIGSMLALTVPPAYAARNSGEQQQHFFRYRMTIANLTALTAGIKIGRLPSRAYLNTIQLHVVTSFNAVTTATIKLGTTQGGADILAATDIKTAGASAVAVPFAGSGLAVTGSGEVDVWAQFAQTGGAPSAGDATIVIGYTPDNDQ